MTKKGVEVLDITELQKRGILKKIPAKKMPDYEKGYFDLSNKTSNATISNTNGQSSQENPFSFLDNLAQTSSNQSSQENKTNIELSDFKVKLEDLEYKMERFLDRIAKLESKLDDLEKKVLS